MAEFRSIISHRVFIIAKCMCHPAEGLPGKHSVTVNSNVFILSENHSEKEILPQPWDGTYVSYIRGLEITQITQITQKHNKPVFFPGVSVSLKN